LRAMAGSAARSTSPENPISQCCSSGTKARSTPGPSPISRPSSHTRRKRCSKDKLRKNKRADRLCDRPPAPMSIKRLLGHGGVHGLAQMRAAHTHLAAQHGILRCRQLLLRRELAVAVSHVFDGGFGFSSI